MLAFKAAPNCGVHCSLGDVDILDQADDDPRASLGSSALPPAHIRLNGSACVYVHPGRAHQAVVAGNIVLSAEMGPLHLAVLPRSLKTRADEEDSGGDLVIQETVMAAGQVDMNVRDEVDDCPSVNLGSRQNLAGFSAAVRRTTVLRRRPIPVSSHGLAPLGRGGTVVCAIRGGYLSLSQNFLLCYLLCVSFIVFHLLCAPS